MRHAGFAAVAAAATLFALPAAAQDFDVGEAEREIAELTAEEYQDSDTLPMSATAVVGLLEQLGYTGIHDFDVDSDEYEVEATSPAGIEVEIELDPVTGEILEIEED